jgi:hypothetical protein
MTPTTATLALKFCNAVFTACPWASPSTWSPAPAPEPPRETFEEFFNSMLNPKPPTP